MNAFPSLLSPSPSFFFCSRPNFHAAKTSKFATETLAMQASDAQKFGINLIIDMGQIATEKDYEDDISSDIS